MNILNSKHNLIKDQFSYIKINSIGYVTGYDAVNLPDGMTIYKPDGYIYGTPIKQQTKSSVFFAKNQTENIYKIVQIQVVENSNINLNIPNSINNSSLKITGARYPSGQALNINLNNILSGYYKSNTGNNYVFGSANTGYSSYTTQNIIAYDKVYGWGYNNSGQAINGNNLTGISGISAGFDHSLAVFSNLRMTGWGNNDFNKALGGNNLTGVVAVSAGSGHSLALLTNLKVTGWGLDNSGQASKGSILTGVVGISAGAYHSLALLANGRVTGWGDNSYNQVSGVGFSSPIWNNTRISKITGAIQVSAGGFHSLTLLANGTITGWGDNSYNQISGIGNYNKWENSAVGVLTGVSKIEAGLIHSIALLNDKNVTGWGNNDYGQANSKCLRAGQNGCVIPDLNCSSNYYQIPNGYDVFGCETYTCSPCPNPPTCDNSYVITSGYDENNCPIYVCSGCPSPGYCSGTFIVTGVSVYPPDEKVAFFLSRGWHPVTIKTLTMNGFSSGQNILMKNLRTNTCAISNQGNGNFIINNIVNSKEFVYRNPNSGFGVENIYILTSSGCKNYTIGQVGLDTTGTFPTVLGSSNSPANRNIIGYDANNCPIYGGCQYKIIICNIGQTVTNVNLRNLAPSVQAGESVTFYIYGNVGSANAGVNNNPSLDTGTWPNSVNIRLVVGPVNGAGCNPNGGVLAGRGQGYCGFEAPNSSRTEAIIVRAGVNLTIENHGVIGGGGGTGGDKGGICGEGGPGAGIPAGKKNTGGVTPQTCCGGEGAASILCGGNGGGGSGSGGGVGQGGGKGSYTPNNAPQNIILEAKASYSFAAESSRPFFG